MPHLRRTAEMEKVGTATGADHKSLLKHSKYKAMQLGLISDIFKLSSSIHWSYHYLGTMLCTTVTALELDPNNNSVKENIRVENERLEEELQQREHGLSTGPGEHRTGSSTHANWSGMSGMGPGMHGAGFTSILFNVPLPPEVANILSGIMNMAAQYGQNAYDHHPENGLNEDSGGRNENDQPDIRVDGNIHLTFEGQEVPIMVVKEHLRTKIVIWIVIPALRSSSADHTKNALALIVLIQYLPRLFLIFPLTSQIVRATGVVTKTAWAGAAYNLLLYMIASHVLGASWYLLAIERQTPVGGQSAERKMAFQIHQNVS